MKKILLRFLTALLLLSLCLGAVACADENGVPDGMIEVTANNMPYHLYVPSGWVAYGGDTSGAYYGSTDTSNVTVVLYLPDNPYITPVEYWDTMLKPGYEAELADFTLLEGAVDCQMGGRDGKKYVFTSQWSGIAYKQMQVIVNDGSWVYTFTYTATAEKYDAHLEEVDRILAQFRY